MNLKYGVTGPLSLEKSLKQDIDQTDLMEKFLKEHFFESEEEGIVRERVLGRIDHLVKVFVQKVAVMKGVNTKNTGGKIFTFGSYRLGVHSKGADIDTLCVVPNFVSRNDFNLVFYEMLVNDSSISEVTKIEDAYVPLIKLKYRKISIDLLFARLNMNSVPENVSLLNNNILRGMDEKCVMSLNGCRVADEILKLVPDTKTYHSALRCIKFWARRRCVYGNIYGYFGGVAYAISVARICQLFPNASSFTIVKKFFEIYSQWKWPLPVILRNTEDLNLNFKMWDPKTNPGDRFHRMPVITPVYPTMCSTHNVILSTQQRMTDEFQRAFEMLSKNFNPDVFNPSDFFKNYKNFVTIFSPLDSIESKLRFLSLKLEALENVAFAPIFPKTFNFEKKDDEDNILRNEAFDFIKSLAPIEMPCSVNFIALDFSGIKHMLNSKKVFLNSSIYEFKKSLDVEVHVNVLKRKDVVRIIKYAQDLNKSD
ncbi:Poly(A) polymerase PAPa [Dictyocoela muelleri]|nr:Poly(A) polymerase PAPa [Dictyocoela muelleri]